MVILVVLQPLTWFQFVWTKYKGVNEPRNPFVRRIYDLSLLIVKSAAIRTGVYLLISLALAATSMVNVIACVEVEVDPTVQFVLSNCMSSWVSLMFFCIFLLCTIISITLDNYLINFL